ncbi:hypothetical protein [Vulcanisaeta distributa]|uniref:Uncharacterized protein n=1 Tax=Vulcanisaeta distributa (strain DSM 14429 / JCM 11212 / NBRC 100878 / IC-017) TaxID=572478 RepID=E1QRI1_VULDI|nr:hypothetical protein [Vulcanisaeta distributa]ADN51795.1 hypothetical protein Vdis_2429 [Vulcanisaeta distributa DSM 14429]
MNEEIQESVVFANLVFVVMTAIYSLAFQLILLFNDSLTTIGLSIAAWLILAYALVARRGPWALLYAKVHRALTGVNVLGITRIERLLLMPYVINYAIAILLTAFTGYSILSLALRIIVTMPMFIMIGEFAVLPRVVMSNHAKMSW